MRTSRVEFRNLTKVFTDPHHDRDITAVDQLSLTIEAGSLVTLLGPSGCGKTTVLRMLAGFETPTAGEIIVGGQDVLKLPANQRKSAMVFQSYALFPHLNVAENICYGLKLRQVSKKEQADRLAKMIELVGLAGYEQRRPQDLSGGQQQRVALARALIVEPELLLFDEPLSNLDAKLRITMRAEIRRIQNELGITTVYVTHDQQEAMAISDRMVVMSAGKIAQHGTPQELYFKPQSRFVAEFMGAANFLEGEVLRIDSSNMRVQFDRRIIPEAVELPILNANITAGEKMTLVVRPESLHAANGKQPHLRGKILHVQYLGSCYEYLVELQPGCLWNVHLPAQGVTLPHQVGESLVFGLAMDELHFLTGASQPMKENLCNIVESSLASLA